MTRWQLVTRSLTHHRAIHIAVALGVAAATAVLTGALLVGDSVRGSLHALTMERLGKIDALLALDRFFQEGLVDKLSSSNAFQDSGRQAAGVILFPQATLEHRAGQDVHRASNVLVLGCDKQFWSFDTAGVRPDVEPGENEVVLNVVLAEELRAKIGDEVTLRLPKSDQVPADSPLANKNDRIRSLPNLKVVGIVPAKGLGRFQLQAAQSLPQNAFVSLPTLQAALEQDDRVNAILVADPGSDTTDVETLSASLQPTLADFGVNVQLVRQSFTDGENEQTAFEYFTVTTDRMLFSPEMADAVESVVKPLGGRRVLTYLANSIERASSDADQAGVPYSMVTAIDFSDGFRPRDSAGNPIPALKPDEIVLNSWTAERLKVQPGETVRLEFFEPETTHGQAIERSAEFVVKAITPLVKPDQPFRRNRPARYTTAPAIANDPHLTPEVKGVTDQDTIDDWDAPFPFDYARVHDEDEEYWEEHRTTPKAFIANEAGVNWWGSRFGKVTSFRVPKGEFSTADELGERLEQELAAKAQQLGFRFLGIKEQQLAAARGTTPFDVLFLFLSFFVIAAALLIVALLFRLGIEQRATEIGTLLAVGFTRAGAGRLFLAEGLVVAALGAGLGVVVGVGYAKLILAGLTTWWLGAISAPFLEFHWTVRSLLLGYVLGVVTAMATIIWAVRETRRFSARGLLSGQTRIPVPYSNAASASGFLSKVGQVFRTTATTVALIVGAFALSGLATRLGGMAQAGAFVGGGALLLLGLILVARRRLRQEGASSRPAWKRSSIAIGLAERSAGRNPGRSVITIALMATATFLIVAMSSFRLDVTDQGVGGFEFLGQSSQPIYEDLNTPEVRNEYFGTRASALEGTTILGLRLRPGDDASCQNLYQAFEPRVVGVTPSFVEYFDEPSATSFEWAGSSWATDQEKANPWRVLLPTNGADSSAPIPVVLDKNTAMYSLHLYRGIGEEFEFTYDGRPLRFQVAGLLSNSVLQGSLFMSEASFRQAFPGLSGYRYFLIGVPADGNAKAVAATLEERFSDEGLDLAPARDILEELLAVQNTYLSTFQSLGALGLLLGAFGLATVQLRNVLERRAELALMRAVGYRRRRLAQLVLLESMLLLGAGLVTGVVAALLAVLPHKLLGDAAFSWFLLRDLGLMLLAVLAAGLISSLLAVRAVLRMPLLASLRKE